MISYARPPGGDDGNEGSQEAEGPRHPRSPQPQAHAQGRPRRRRAIVSFTLDGIHPHDAGTILGEDNIAVRTGHHCAQPVMAHFVIPATIRASFSVYNTLADIDALVAGLRRAQEILL